MTKKTTMEAPLLGRFILLLSLSLAPFLWMIGASAVCHALEVQVYEVPGQIEGQAAIDSHGTIYARLDKDRIAVVRGKTVTTFSVPARSTAPFANAEQEGAIVGGKDFVAHYRPDGSRKWTAPIKAETVDCIVAGERSILVGAMQPHGAICSVDWNGNLLWSQSFSILDYSLPGEMGEDKWVINMMDGLLVFDTDGRVVCKKSPYMWFEPPAGSPTADAIFAVAVPQVYRFSPDLARIEWSVKVPKLRMAAPVALDDGGVAVLAKHGDIVWLNATGQEVAISSARERVVGPIVSTGSGIVGGTQNGGVWLFKPNQPAVELLRSNGRFLSGVALTGRHNQVIAANSGGQIYLINLGDAPGN